MEVGQSFHLCPVSTFSLHSRRAAGNTAAFPKLPERSAFICAIAQELCFRVLGNVVLGWGRGKEEVKRLTNISIKEKSARLGSRKVEEATS